MSNISNRKILIERYTSAFFAACDQKVSNEIIEQLKFLKKILTENIEIQKLLTCPLYNKKNIIGFWENISDHYRLNIIIKGLLLTLTNNLRLTLLEKIILSIIDKFKEINGECKITLIVARKPEEKILENIKQELTKKLKLNINLEIEVDASILQGMILKINSIMIDASLKNKLEKLKSLFKQSIFNM